MLGSQFDVNLLSELLSIIKKCFIPNNQPIVGIMCGIVSNMEMSIISLLMNDEDKLGKDRKTLFFFSSSSLKQTIHGFFSFFSFRPDL